jgi:hypothetical protein
VSNSGGHYEASPERRNLKRIRETQTAKDARMDD